MGTKIKIKMKLASSGSLDGIRQLIAEFYVTTPDRIGLTREEKFWKVTSGDKSVTPVVVQQGRRFVFGTLG